MRKSIIILIVTCFIFTLVAACSSKENSNPKGSCKVDYVSSTHTMERITFSGGYIRSSAEPIEDNIVATALKGSKGIIYGKRKINDVEWAKVTTRAGTTGWYCLEPGDNEKEKAENKEALDVNTKRFVVTYPVISGIDKNVAEKINSEIKSYMEVFNLIAGPVGNNLRCLVTYNKNNILSILFEAPLINNRVFKAEDVNDSAMWSNIRKYCYVSRLISDAIPDILYAKKVDMQYGMVFDLKTGERLRYKTLLKLGSNSDLSKNFREFGNEIYVANDNFFLNSLGTENIFVDVTSNDVGRKIIELDKKLVIDLDGRK